MYRRLSHSKLGELAKPSIKKSRARRNGHYSNFDEESIIERLTNRDDIIRFCVDIGASDGLTMSNTLALFERGWAGLSAELDGPNFAALARLHAQFPKSSLFRGRVSPDMVCSLFRTIDVPRNFGLLNLDIDSYDYFVLEAILGEYRPSVICAEINEKIPPPIKFTVNYSPEAFTDGHFHGQSICQLDLLRERFDYVFVQLEYNDAFLMPAELATSSLSAEDAYRLGYADRPDRLNRMPWNRDMEPLQGMDPASSIAFLDGMFSAQSGRYTLRI